MAPNGVHDGKARLQGALAVSLFGVTVSRALTYHAVFGTPAATCPAPGASGTVFGYPASVYRFFRYLAITVIAVLGVQADRPKRAELT